MKPQRILTVVTLFNVLVLLFSLSQTRAVMAEGAGSHGQDAGWHDRLP